jgi:hypothetical protein
VKTKYPWYTPERVMQRVRVTADNIDALNPLAYRRQAGVTAVSTPTTRSSRSRRRSPSRRRSFTTSDGDGIIEPGATVTVNLGVTNWLSACTGVDFKLRKNSIQVTMVDSAATLPSMDSLSSASLPPFSFTVSRRHRFRRRCCSQLAINDDLAGLHRPQPLRADDPGRCFATHDANNIDCSVTSVGKLGYALTRWRHRQGRHRLPLQRLDELSLRGRV